MNRYRISQLVKEQGPYTINQLRSMWSLGQKTADALYQQRGMTSWKPIESLGLDSSVQAILSLQAGASLQPILPSTQKAKHSDQVTTKSRRERLVEIVAYRESYPSRGGFTCNTPVAQLEVVELLQARPAEAEGHAWA